MSYYTKNVLNFAMKYNNCEELRCNSSLYFLFEIFEGIRIKEFGNGDIQTVTDFLDGGDTRVFALIVND